MFSLFSGISRDDDREGEGGGRKVAGNLFLIYPRAGSAR